jgi:hypothetical protein
MADLAPALARKLWKVALRRIVSCRDKLGAFLLTMLKLKCCKLREEHYEPAI